MLGEMVARCQLGRREQVAFHSLARIATFREGPIREDESVRRNDVFVVRGIADLRTFGLRSGLNIHDRHPNAAHGMAMGGRQTIG